MPASISSTDSHKIEEFRTENWVDKWMTENVRKEEVTNLITLIYINSFLNKPQEANIFFRDQFIIHHESSFFRRLEVLYFSTM